MELKSRDYALVKLATKLAPLMRSCGELESFLLRKQLATVKIDKPVFVTGLARSGTTIVLTSLASADGVVTHQYRDFPMLWTPVLWNRVQGRPKGDEQAVERPHRDRIRITRDSPEAFEEPIWQSFFTSAHDAQKLHLLDTHTDAPDFAQFYTDHIKKLLVMRGGDRYLSKGNYNVARIAYLAKLFPDARFIVPVREPLAHVHSLVKQHKQFEKYAQQDGRVPGYLRAAGHYEFGPQRQPINLSPDRSHRVAGFWQSGDEYRGYAAMWAEVYEYMAELTRPDSPIADRIHVSRFEDLCDNPRLSLQLLVAFANFADRSENVLEQADMIRPPADKRASIGSDDRASVIAETTETAARFGYRFN